MASRGVWRRRGGRSRRCVSTRVTSCSPRSSSGLLLPHAGAAIVVPAALVATLAGRALPACLAVAALLGGASLADARLAALDAGVIANSHGRALTARAVVLEPVRERAAGPAVARIRLLEGLGAGEQVVMRVRRNAYAGRLWSSPSSGGAAAPGRTRPVAPARGWPEVGDVVVVRGKIEPLGAFDAYQARRNAHGAIAATRVVPTGERRGGVLGSLDGIRRAAERGLESNLAAPEAALLRGMVLGEDEWLTAGRQGRLPGVGARAHPRRQRPERDAAGDPRARRGRARRLAAAGAAAARGRADRALRPVDRCRPVDPASRGDGRRRPGGRPRRAPVSSLVRVAAGRSAHAGAQPARGGGARLAALVRGRRRTPRRHRTAALGAGAQAARTRRRGGGDHDRRDGRNSAADGAPLRRGLARVAARRTCWPRRRSRR